MKVVANMVVKNEEEYLDRVLTQVEKFADEILVFDTGSTDGTLEILKKHKVKFEVSDKPIAVLRNTLLNKTEGDWVFFVDGDEVWEDEEIERLKQLVATAPDTIVAYSFSFIHFIAPDKIADHKSRGVKLIRNTPSVRFVKAFPNEVLYDNKGLLISVAGGGVAASRKDIIFVEDVFFKHYGGIKKNQWREEQPKKFRRLSVALPQAPGEKEKTADVLRRWQEGEGTIWNGSKSEGETDATSFPKPEGSTEDPKEDS